MCTSQRKDRKGGSFLFLFVETIFLMCITAPIFEMLTNFDVAAAADHVAPQIKSEMLPGFDHPAVLKCGFLVFLRLN